MLQINIDLLYYRNKNILSKNYYSLYTNYYLHYLQPNPVTGKQLNLIIDYTIPLQSIARSLSGIISNGRLMF